MRGKQQNVERCSSIFFFLLRCWSFLITFLLSIFVGGMHATQSTKVGDFLLLLKAAIEGKFSHLIFSAVVRWGEGFFSVYELVYVDSLYIRNGIQKNILNETEKYMRDDILSWPFCWCVFSTFSVRCEALYNVLSWLGFWYFLWDIFLWILSFCLWRFFK